MFVFSDLFIVRQGFVETYRFDFESNVLQPRLAANSGEISQALTSDFWEWWSDCANFVVKEHQVDFAFISDTATPLLQIPNDFQKTDTTNWTLPFLCSLCDNLFKNEEIVFYEDDKKVWEIHGGITMTPSRYYFSRFNLPQADQRKKRRADASTDDEFIQYLKANEYPNIIIKDIIR